MDSNADFEPFEQRAREVEIAARSIVSICRNDGFGRGWRPKGIDEVAILLESLGYSGDIVAELWYPDLFALARDVTTLIDQYVSDEERSEQRDLSWFVNACRDYAIGSLYSGPWIIAVIGLAVFGASLWSSLSTPLHLATAIALGVYVAQLVSGFYSQAIARRLTFYFLQHNAGLMRWTFERFIALALGTTLLAALILWAAVRAAYGDPDAWLAASFCAGSAIFQLSLVPLYTLRRFAWIIAIATVSTLVTGATFMLLFHRHVDVPWEPATLAVEIGAAGAIVLLATYRWLARGAASAHGDFVPPALRSIVASTLPYAAFGLLYFASILCDRIFAGIASGGGHTYAYSAVYELGADVALLAMLPVTGVVNVILEALPKRILAGSKVGIGESGPMQAGMSRFYALGVLAVLASTIAAIALGEIAGARVVASPYLGGGNPDALLVLRFAVVGYALIMLGLLNAQLLFFLSRPFWPLVGSGAACAVSIAWCSVALVLHAQPGAMVGGLVCGAAAFVIVTTVAAAAAMRSFTYTYYAAY
ncbi:MAG: hypothetical protein ACYDGM_03080 [Vulcanimicrobiaceae bacterium]